VLSKFDTLEWCAAKIWHIRVVCCQNLMH
jgi:hypothetical protein